MRGRGPRGGFRSSCGGDGSTSTLNQHQKNDLGLPSVTPDNTPFSRGSPRTLEDMILHLEVEEDIVRRARLRESYDGSYDNCDDGDDDDKIYHQPSLGFMIDLIVYVLIRSISNYEFSCLLLRSARNALNQYPRFLLDGKDAMYRSPFQRQLGTSVDMTMQGGRRSHYGDQRPWKKSSQMSLKKKRLPRTVAEESVVWCKTGVVAKLMGLELIPVPAKGKKGKDKLGTLLKRERLRRRERTLDINGRTGPTKEASCSSGGFNMTRPIGAVGSPSCVGGWPTFRFP